MDSNSDVHGECAITVKRPQECSQAELGEFKRLVLLGDEVTDQGLSHLIREAHRLLFLQCHGSVVGSAALKNPRSSYRESVFNKSRATLEPVLFPFELGWVFIVEGARGRGLSHHLTQAAVGEAAGRPIFATTRSNNQPMQACLKTAGFHEHGSEYESSRASVHLRLFVRLESNNPQLH